MSVCVCARVQECRFAGTGQALEHFGGILDAVLAAAVRQGWAEEKAVNNGWAGASGWPGMRRA